jgi:hypothetical protein
MYEEHTLLAGDRMALELGRIMGHVVDHVHPQVLGRAPERRREHLPNTVQDYLAVGVGHVDAALHGCEVVATFGRILADAIAEQGAYTIVSGQTLVWHNHLDHAIGL